MATIPLVSCEVAYTVSGNSPLVRIFPEASSQTFKKGEFVYLSGGYVTEVGDNPGVILGMAAEDAHNDSAGVYNVAVVIAHPDVVFRMNKVDSSDVAAVTAVTDVGKAFAFYRDTTDSQTHVYIAEGGNAAYGRLICIDHSNLDTVGDTGGRLDLYILGKYCQLFCTS